MRKRTASASVEGRAGRPSCMVLAGFSGHAPAGTFGRLSTFWPGEFHPFATVSTPKDSEGGEQAPPTLVAVLPCPATYSPPLLP